MNIKIEYTNNEKAPAIITKGKYSTPVWIQQKWEDGEYSQYIQKNGCGHCCVAMALNLSGINIDPHAEYTHCRKLWGEPRMGEPLFEDHFLSETGIMPVVESFGIPAKA